VCKLLHILSRSPYQNGSIWEHRVSGRLLNTCKQSIFSVRKTLRGTCPSGRERAVLTCMKLRMARNWLGIAVLGSVTGTAVFGQQANVATPPASGVLAAAHVSWDSIAPADPSPELSASPSASNSLLRTAVLPAKPQPVRTADNQPTDREVRIWKTLVVAQHSAAAFDAWSTRRSIESGNGYERNVLMRPFANSVAIYPMLQIAPFGFDFLSHRMMRSQNRFFRKTWWLPQLASTGASLVFGARNLRVADLKR